MARILAKRRRQLRRIKRGRQELAELNWGDRSPKDYDEPEDWAASEYDDEEDDEEDDNWDGDAVDDWDDDWEPPPDVWEEDDLD